VLEYVDIRGHDQDTVRRASVTCKSQARAGSLNLGKDSQWYRDKLQGELRRGEILEVFAVVTVNKQYHAVFWDVTQCSSCRKTFWKSVSPPSSTRAAWCHISEDDILHSFLLLGIFALFQPFCIKWDFVSSFYITILNLHNSDLHEIQAHCIFTCEV
jgi:hypothetical protein